VPIPADNTDPRALVRLLSRHSSKAAMKPIDREAGFQTQAWWDTTEPARSRRRFDRWKKGCCSFVL
jgi:hypothetical protein